MKLNYLTIPLLNLIGASALPLVNRQNVGLVANEFEDGGCRDIIFIFARASVEPGNMGITVGPPTAEGLKRAFGADKVAVDGVEYPALLTTNLLPGGASIIGVRDMTQTLTDAATRCPASKIVAGGYSQGAAVTHAAITDLPQAVKEKIVGVVTYGDTRNAQDNGQIPNFPPEKVKVICNDGDLVCSGTLVLLPPHFDYIRRVDEGVEFLTEKIRG